MTIGDSSLMKKHHAALPYRQMGEFMAELREQEGTAARALELTVVAAARTGEVVRAKWAEIDWDEGLWTRSTAYR
jgi:integrase